MVNITGGKASLSELTVNKLTIVSNASTSTNAALKPVNENGVTITNIQPTMFKTTTVTLTSDQTITLPIKTTDTILSVSVILQDMSVGNASSGSIYPVENFDAYWAYASGNKINLFSYRVIPSSGNYAVLLQYCSNSNLPNTTGMKCTIRVEWVKNS